MGSALVARAVFCIVSLALIASGCSSDADDGDSSGADGDSVPSGSEGAGRSPSVSVPAAEGNGIQALATDFDFASLGSVREEFFFAGDAVGYEMVGEFGRDGAWEVEEGESAPFATRMVVVRPIDPADFSGTVFVEWFNVTGGIDAGATWISGHNQMLRSGAAWVGVTAQAVGVNGGTEAVRSAEIDIPQGGLVTSDPARYGTLSHPGDLFSYDIFTQAGAAIRGDGDGVDPLEGLDAEQLIAMGESQSAGRLTTYVNAVHPRAGLYDGFLIYSRGATAAPLGDRPSGGVDDPAIPDVVQIRTDVDVPVFTFETEYDVDVLGFADARQPDSETFRLWEIAGTSHQDAYSAGGYALTDLGDGSAEGGLLDPARASGGLLNCEQPLNAGAMHAPLAAALSHLETWVRDGEPPPEFERIEITGEGDGIEIVRDELGIAQGGVRTPIVDVPLAANVGDAGNTPDFCRVFGHTRPFDAATLARLYPNGSSDYIPAFEEAADQAVEAGVWLEPEATNFTAAAGTIDLG